MTAWVQHQFWNSYTAASHYGPIIPILAVMLHVYMLKKFLVYYYDVTFSNSLIAFAAVYIVAYHILLF